MLQRQLISVIVMNFCSLLLTISCVTLALICKNNEMEFAALFQPYDGGKNFEICAQDILLDSNAVLQFTKNVYKLLGLVKKSKCCTAPKILRCRDNSKGSTQSISLAR